ncbi:MAG: hypothetical protein HY908_11755 [Myxococcales bacterium]|nr:hypothetical protein [Myxococcales bacterium]
MARRAVPLLCVALGAAACSDGSSAGTPTFGGGSGTASTTGGSGGSAEGGSGGAPVGPTELHRIGPTVEIPTIAGAAPKRFADVAYDPAHDVYLVVHGNAATGGAFLDADAQTLGAPFAIADTAAWTQAPRVAFASSGAALVAWHDTREDPNVARVRARIVRWSGAAAELASPDFPVSSTPSYGEMPPGIGYSPTSDLFLVVWHALPGDDLHALRVTPAGQVLGPETALTTDPDWQSDAAVAWNPERDEFLVAYSHAGAGAEIRVQRVAADGALPGGALSVATAGGTWLPQLAYVPATGRYLCAWYDGTIGARWLDPDGASLGAPFALAPGYGAYDGFALARHAGLHTSAAALHGPTDEDFAVGVNDLGTPGSVLEATSEAGADGHFNPRLAAHATRPEWLLATVRAFQAVVVQRLGM